MKRSFRRMSAVDRSVTAFAIPGLTRRLSHVAAFLALLVPCAAQAEQLFAGSALVLPGDPAFLFGPIVAEDLNGDGRADLAYLSGTQALATMVRLALPDGTLGLATTYPEGRRPVGAADLTEDGVVDLLTMIGPYRVLPGIGDGTFGSAIKTVATGGIPTQDLVAIGDVDDDGHLDFARHVGQAVRIDRGLGNGMFDLAPLLIPFGEWLGPPSLVDLNLDGQLDLLASTSPGLAQGVTWAFGLGDGQFGSVEHVSAWTGSSFTRVTPGDLDDDSFPDAILAAGPDPSVAAISVFRHEAGAFALKSVVDLPARPARVHVGDVDGDGLADILVACSDYSSAAGPTVFLKGTGGFDLSLTAVTPTDFTFELAAYGDFNGDGRLDVGSGDVLVCDSISCTFVLDLAFGLGDGTFETPGRADMGSPSDDVAALDLDGDGHIDLAACGTSAGGHVRIGLGLGDGTFVPPVAEIPASFAERIHVADATGDGVPDVLTSATGPAGGAQLFPADAQGSLGAGLTVVAGSVRDAAFLDADLDGAIDLALSRPDLGGIQLFAGQGNGQFDPPAFIAVAPDVAGVAAGDPGLDGWSDIVVARDQTALAVMLSGAVGFDPALAVELPMPANAHEVLVIDLTRDGQPDVVTACGELAAGSAPAMVVHAASGVTFDSGSVWPVDLAADEVAAADFDRDGLVDVVLGKHPASLSPDYPVAYELVHSSPGAAFTERVPLRAGGPVSGLDLADFDGDGFPDIVASLPDKPHLLVHLNRSGDWTTLGHALPSSEGVPLLKGSGAPVPDQLVSVTASLVPPSSLGVLFIGLGTGFLPLQGGLLVPVPGAVVPILPDQPITDRWPAELPAGAPVYVQAWFQSLVTGEVSASNALVTIGQ